MEQPIRYELLLQAAECLERAREAEQQGNLEKGQALRAEAQELLERSRKGVYPGAHVRTARCSRVALVNAFPGLM
jgi:hypothetical protein